MEEIKDIRDDQIRVIGEEDRNGKNPHHRLLPGLLVVAILIVAGIVLLSILRRGEAPQADAPEPGYFEPVEVSVPIADKKLGCEVDSLERGFTEILDTMMNDIPLKIYIPHNASLTLHIGRLNRQDSTVIYAAQAADVRADNGKIVGAFVLKGVPLAWGLSKTGFCAAIDGVVTVGVAENSPLFEQATEKGGYFFRQYPLVDNGRLVENELKGKSIRRGICDRQGEIFMVESLTPESFHDFAQALVDLGVDQAVYLVGSISDGWATDRDGNRHEFGNPEIRRRNFPKNTSYLVWRRSQL